jgi:hypothetical protein
LSGYVHASPLIIVGNLTEDAWKSCNDARPEVSECPGGGAIRLITLILVFAVSAAAQSVPADITTIEQPGSGHAVFDASRATISVK